MSKYFGSKQHRENAKRGAILAGEKSARIKKERIIDYNKNPKKCLFCDKAIEYENKNTRKFCNSSCAASYSNKRRVVSEETKK